MTEEQKIQITKGFEGISYLPYRCSAGKLTIGYGHNIEDRGISQGVAELMLKEDMEIAQKEVASIFPFFNKLNSERQFVLEDMCFNMGISRLTGFKKMLAAIEKEDFETAAKEMLDSNWAKQVGRRADYLAIVMKLGKI